MSVNGNNNNRTPSGQQSYGSGGGVTSMSNHRQRFQQMQSPGSGQKRTSIVPQKQLGGGANNTIAANGSAQQHHYQGGIGQLKSFLMTKQNSQVRQDDAIVMRPNTTFKGTQQSTTTLAGHTFSTASFANKPPASSATTMAQSYKKNNSNNQIMTVHLAAADQHDCTNEEQIDEFDMVDREEVFDECDEQTGMQRHQMNVGLSRHPIKNSAPSEMFKVFNRSGSQSHIMESQPAYSAAGAGAKVGSSIQGNTNRTNQMQRSSGKAIQDKQSYNDFLRSSSPNNNQNQQHHLINQNNRSREGSLSPPPLAHFQREAFFGSSFAANGLIRQQQSNEKNAQMAASFQDKSTSQNMRQQNNTFALSTINRMRPFANNSEQSGSFLNAQRSLLNTAQDKGPQNFKNIDMRVHQIPDQFRADLQGLVKQKHDQIESSIQQDEETEEERETQTFDLSHSLIPSGKKQKNNYFHQADPQITVTDQDTIIDQDDDVAEESSAIEQQQQQQDPGLQQVTQHHDGPVVYRFMNKTGQEEDIQDETAIEEEQQRQGFYQSWNRGGGLSKKFGTQQSPSAFGGYSQAHQRQPSSNPQLLQESAPVKSTTTNSMVVQQPTTILLASQSSTSFSAKSHQGVARGPLANKPKTAVMVGTKHHQSSQQVNPQLFPHQQQQHSSSRPTHLLTNQAHTTGSVLNQNNHSNSRSLSRLSKSSSQQPNPQIQAASQFQHVIKNNNLSQYHQNENGQEMLQSSQRRKSDVCETVEDIQESLVFMTNRKGDANNQSNNGYSDVKETPVLDNKFYPKVCVLQDTDDFNEFEDHNQVPQVMPRRVTLTKRDNKDCKDDQKMPGDISITELQSTTFHPPSQEESKDILNNDKNKLAVYSAAAGAPNQSSHMIDFRHGTFRSPKGSPSNTININQQVQSFGTERRENNADIYSGQQEKMIIANSGQNCDGDTAEQTSQGIRHNTANFQSSNQRMNESNISLQKREDQQPVERQSQTTTKSNLELQREFLEVQRKLKEMQMTTQSQNQQSFHDNGRQQQQQFFDNKHQSDFLHKQPNNESISDMAALQQNHNERRQTVNHAASSSRLTPKSHLANKQMHAFQYNNGQNKVVEVASSERNYPNQRQNQNGNQTRINGAQSNSQIRQVRMSARPGGQNRGEQLDTRGIVSPDAGHLSYRKMQINSKRSPISVKQLGEQESGRESASAKNFNIGSKQDKMKLRQSRTFVEEETNVDIRDARHPQIQGGHNRSVMSNGEQIGEAYLAAQSMVIPGTKKNRGGHAQLQALAELRQRENHTVQTGGQMLLGRQRSREAYLDPMNKGGNKSTHDRLNVHQTSDQAPVTERPSMRPPSHMRRDQYKNCRSTPQQDIRGVLNHQTEQAENDGRQHLVTHNFSKGTFEERNFDSVENGGFTAEYEDDGLAADDEQDEDDGFEPDVLSRSQSEEDIHAGYDNDDCGDDDMYGDEDDDEGYYQEQEDVEYVENQSLSAEEFDGEDVDDDYASEDQDDQYYVEERQSNYSSSNLPQQFVEAGQSSTNYHIMSQQNRGVNGGRVRIPNQSIRAVYNATGLPPKQRAMINHHSGASSDNNDDNISQKRGGGQMRRHDSQRRGAQQQQQHQRPGSHRQRSPNDNKSSSQHNQYSERKHLRPDKGAKVNERAKHQRQQKGGARADSRSEIQVDRNMKAQFNVSHNARRRNQPLKININMTGGSSQNPNNQLPIRQDTAQSVNSMSNQGLAQQQQMTPQQQMYMYPNQQQPGMLMYPPPQPPQAADPAHQQLQFMLQQQHQQNQQQAVILNQIAAQSQQNSFLPQPFGSTNLGGINAIGQQVPPHLNANSTTLSQKQLLSQAGSLSPNQQKHVLKEGTVATAEPSEQAPSTTQDVNRIQEEPSNSISWLNVAVEKVPKVSTEAQSEKRKVPQNHSDDVDMDDLWAKLKNQEQSTKNQSSHEKSNQDFTKSSAPAESAVKQEQEQDTEELENFLVAKPKKKAEALIIGFEVQDQFAKKPILGQKAKQQRLLKNSSKTNSQDEEITEQPQIAPKPLGSDFKKISIDQIKAREERLKKIKDQGLIEIPTDTQPEQANLGLAEAFLAKKRARQTGGVKDLDQDLAIARDTSTSAAKQQTQIPVQKAEKVQKTPQELAEIRKAMMKKRCTASARPDTNATPTAAANIPVPKKTGTESVVSSSKLTKARPSLSSQRPTPSQSQSTSKIGGGSTMTKEPSTALMERLAGGKRTVIDKKEMKKLSKINYENLPEIKRRKEEERKRQEALIKKERIAQYNKDCKAQFRAKLKKKRDQAANTTVPASAAGTESEKPPIAVAQISLKGLPPKK